MNTDFVPVDPKPVLEPDVLYFGDNERCFCGAHAGMSARYTGRDISGRRVLRVSDRDREEWRREVGYPPACETCKAIRRSAMATTALRAFTAAEYETFGHVETNDPRISKRDWGVVILDGERVDVVLADDQMTCFGTAFFRRGVARLVAEHIAAMQNPTHAEIEEFLEASLPTLA